MKKILSNPEFLIIGSLTVLTIFGIFYTGSKIQNFYSDFLPNFFSDLLTGVIIVSLLSFLYSASNRPNLKIIHRYSPTTDSLTHLLIFQLRNIGNVPFKEKEVYWHILIENSIVEKINEDSLSKSIFTINGTTYNHYSNLYEGPVFIKRFNEILRLSIFKPADGHYNYFYYLSTPYGIFPKNTRITDDNEFEWDNQKVEIITIK
jgi:hypothetical protein